MTEALLDALPGRAAYLLRWNHVTRTVELSPYDPAADREGPPQRFPYTRLLRRPSRSGP